MKMLCILFLFFFYFEKNAVFGKYYYVKADGKADADCSEGNPCQTISVAIGKSGDYDTVCVNGDLKEIDTSIEVDHTVNLRSLTSGTKVNIPVTKKDLTSGDELFHFEEDCTMKDFKFTLGSAADKTPDYCIICTDSYIRLENIEFVRDSATEKTALTHSLISYGRESSDDINIYLHSCTFTDIELAEDSLIGGGRAAFYNSNFTKITLKQYSGSVYSGSGELHIIDCIFDTCKCLNGVGGAIDCRTDKFIIGGYNSNTTFKGCSAEVTDTGKGSNEDKRKTYGGAISLYISDLVYDYYNISNVEFGSGDTANKADIGANIFFGIDYVEGSCNSTHFPLLDDMEDNTNLYAIAFSAEEKYYPMVYLLDLNKIETVTQIYLGGTDEEKDCKTTTTACSSFSKAIKLISYGNYSLTFVGDYELESITLPGSSFLRCDRSTIDASRGYFILNGPSVFDSLKFNLSNSVSYYNFITSYSNLVLYSTSFNFKDGVSSCSFSRYLVKASKILTIESCTFKNLRNSQNDGLINADCYSITISACTFESCESSGKGGPLYLKCYAAKENTCNVNISSNTFKKCKGKCGGGVYIEISDYKDKYKYNIDVFSLTFGTGDDRNIAEYGQNIFVESLNDFLINSKCFTVLEGLSESASLDNEIQLYSYCRSVYIYSLSYNPIVNMLTYSNGDCFAKELFVGGGGDDNKTCKDKDNMCKTINVAVSKYPMNITDITVIGETNISVTTSFSVFEHTFKGDSKDTKLVLREDAYLGISYGTVKDFDIHVGSDHKSSYCILSLSCVILENIKLTSDNGAEKSTYIFGAHGYINMNNCSVSDIEAESAIFDDDYTISLNLINCVFKNLKYKADDDHTVCYKLTDSKINSTTFENCVVSKGDEEEEGYGGGLSIEPINNVYIGGKGTTEFKKCSAGFGGAIYLDVSAAFSFVLDGLTFGEGGDANVATYGKNIYVESGCLDLFADFDHFSTLEKVSDEDNHLYDFFNGEDDKGNLITGSLVKLIKGEYRKGEAMYYVGDEGNNENDCTAENKLCKDLDLDEKVAFNIVNVTVVKSLTLSDDFSPSWRYDVKGKSADVKIIPESGYFYTAIDCSFSSLVFEIDDRHQYLFHPEYRTLNITSCSIKPKNSVASLGSSLIYVSGGGSLIMENCEISNIDLFECEGGYSMGKGCALQIELSEYCEVLIRGVIFTNCKTLYKNGGGIYVSVDNGSTFIIEKSKDQKTSLKGCVANAYPYKYRIIWKENDLDKDSDYGRGGGIYMYVESAPKKLKVDCEFGEQDGEMNEAPQGYDIFVVGENLKKIMNLDNFPCLDGKGSGYRGAMGYDESAEDEEDALITNLAKYAKDNGGGFPIWAIILIVVLCVLVIVIIVVVIIICCVCRKKKKVESSDGDDKEKKETKTVNVDSDGN